MNWHAGMHQHCDVTALPCLSLSSTAKQREVEDSSHS